MASSRRAVGTATIAVLLLCSLSGAVAVDFVEENPWGVAVTAVHAVFSNHFVRNPTAACEFINQ